MPLLMRASVRMPQRAFNGMRTPPPPLTDSADVNCVVVPCCGQAEPDGVAIDAGAADHVRRDPAWLPQVEHEVARGAEAADLLQPPFGFGLEAQACRIGMRAVTPVLDVSRPPTARNVDNSTGN